MRTGEHNKIMRIMRVMRSAALVRAAVALLVVAALMPGISRLLASEAGSQQRQFLQEICSAYAGLSGLVSRPADQAPAPLKSMAACPYCLPQAGLPELVMPAAAPRVLLPLYFLPRLFRLAPAPLFAWVNARSRAPPAA